MFLETGDWDVCLFGKSFTCHCLEGDDPHCLGSQRVLPDLHGDLVQPWISSLLFRWGREVRVLNIFFLLLKNQHCSKLCYFHGLRCCSTKLSLCTFILSTFDKFRTFYVHSLNLVQASHLILLLGLCFILFCSFLLVWLGLRLKVILVFFLFWRFLTFLDFFECFFFLVSVVVVLRFWSGCLYDNSHPARRCGHQRPARGDSARNTFLRRQKERKKKRWEKYCRIF